MSKKNLAVTNTTDFTILENGDAFISQSKAANALGVPRSTLRGWIKSATLKNDINTNEFNQLDARSFQKMVKVATLKGYEKADELLDLLLDLSAKVYIYEQAGYQFNAVPRSELLENKRLAQWVWSDSLKFQREKIGKKTSNFHYSNENLMLNQVVLGERRAFAEHEMTNKQIEILERGRTLNGAMIDLNLPFQDRKLKLIDWFNNL